MLFLGVNQNRRMCCLHGTQESIGIGIRARDRYRRDWMPFLIRFQIKLICIILVRHTVIPRKLSKDATGLNLF